MANYRTIGDVFQTKGLVVPTLKVLVPDGQLYDVMAIQPAGNLVYRPDFVGHAKSDEAIVYFTKYFQLGQLTQPDLVLTPEYSCPWEALIASMKDRPPNSGKIWVVGCESISPASLAVLIDQNPTFCWIHEDLPQGRPGFLDIVAYVTMAQTKEGDSRIVAVLQLKTQAMVDREEEFERDHLITGNDIYIWHNPDDIIRLLTLICSDALTERPFASPECNLGLHPFIILHPQLNIDPRHADMRSYREQIFASGRAHEVEVFTLNWSKGFTFNGQSAKSSHFGASSIYTQSDRFNDTDPRVASNQAKGLYYHFWQCRHTSLCVFNFDEHVFRFQIPKVRNNGPAALTDRTGPEMISVLRFVDGEWQVGEQVNDGFAALRDHYGEVNCNFFDGPEFSCVDRERLYALSSGSLTNLNKWPSLKSIPAFQAETDEQLNRVTFSQDPSPKANAFRTECLGRFSFLYSTILPHSENFPDCILDLRDAWTACLPIQANEFRHNLTGTNGQAGATGIFIGFRPRHHAEQLRDLFIASWNLEKTRRLVVWHIVDGAPSCVHPPLPNITDSSDHPASIFR